MPEQAIYLSRAADTFSAADLEEILRCSRRNNFELGVTGALTMVDDLFLQILEGPAEALEMLLDTIATDRRHCAMDVLARRQRDAKDFPDWTMGHVTITGPGMAWRDDMTRLVETKDNPQVADQIVALLQGADSDQRMVSDRV